MREEPLLRLVWRAISHPRAFFARLDDRPQLALALAVMGVSALTGSLIVAALALRATGSDAWAPALLERAAEVGRVPAPRADLFWEGA